ncbi:aldehyde dehydrogenase family protein, partial [Vibrio owensii]
MSAQPLYDIDQPEAALRPTLEKLKSAFLTIPNPSAGMRIERLQRLHSALLAYQDRLIDAVDQDFNGRSNAETLMIELLPILEGIHYNKKNLRKWMKPSRRKTPLMLFGAKTKVHYQPLGVVGIVVPWNFPIFLGLSPLAGALAAGNLAMIKTSEFAPKTGKVMKQMISEYFTSDEVVVVNGGVEVATEFTKLPFDHIVFTGSTQVGSIVMQAAAQNLTP